MFKQISRNQKLGLFSSVLIMVLASVFISSALMDSGVLPKAFLNVYAAGVPDSYGNKIDYVAFMQNSTGSWVATATVTSTTYTNGTSVIINANQHTIIVVSVYLNITLASSLGEASTRARVYINITGVVTNGVCVYTGGVNAGVFWALGYSYPSPTSSPTTTWIPATDTTYPVTVLYQAYY